MTARGFSIALIVLVASVTLQKPISHRNMLLRSRLRNTRASRPLRHAWGPRRDCARRRGSSRIHDSSCNPRTHDFREGRRSGTRRTPTISVT